MYLANYPGKNSSNTSKQDRSCSRKWAKYNVQARSRNMIKMLSLGEIFKDTITTLLGTHEEVWKVHYPKE